MEKGSARRSTLTGRERAIVNQTNIGSVSSATLGKLPRNGVERVWTFPSAQIPSCAYTGLGFELFVWTLVADFCELCSHVKVVPSMMLLLCWIVCPGCSGIRSRIP